MSVTLQEMYPAIANSPATVTTGPLSAAGTEVAVGDSAVFGLDLPQLAVLGDGANAETVLITAVNGNLLTITRAVEGVAKAWAAGTVMARNFCAIDHNTLIENIKSIVTEFNGHEGNNDIHLTPESKANLITKTDVVNTLDNDATDKPLSAAQGKAISEKIGDIDAALDLINGEVI